MTFAPTATTRTTLLLRLRPDAPGREFAWQEFVEAYVPIICAFARRFGAPASEIDDLVQDVLLGFYSAVPEFSYDPARGRFRSYLKTCTWRKLQVRLGNRLEVRGHKIQSLDSAEPAIEQAWCDVWENQRLQRALALTRDHYLSRPDRARTFLAFEMYTLLERPAEDVARELQMNVDAVHQAKTRITRALRETMDAMDAFAD